MESTKGKKNDRTKERRREQIIMTTTKDRERTDNTFIKICDTDSDKETIVNRDDDSGRLLVFSNADCFAEEIVPVELPVKMEETQGEWNAARNPIETTYNDTLTTLFAQVPEDHFPEQSRILASSQEEIGCTKSDQVRGQANLGLNPYLMRQPMHLRDTILRKEHFLSQDHLVDDGYCFHKCDEKTARQGRPKEESKDSANTLVSSAQLSDPMTLRDLATLFATTKMLTGGITMYCLKKVATGKLKKYLEHNNLENGWLAVKRSKLDLFRTLLVEEGYLEGTESSSASQLHDNNNNKKDKDNDKGQSFLRIVHAIREANVSLSGTQIELACLSTMSRFQKGIVKRHVDHAWMKKNASVALHSLLPKTKNSNIFATCSAAKINDSSCKSAFTELSRTVFVEYEKGFRFKSRKHMISVVALYALKKRKADVSLEHARREKKTKVAMYKQLHNAGDTVYTCENKDEMNDDWVIGKIISWKKVGEADQYGESRTYHVTFEDGTEVKDVFDYFVKTVEDYQWSIRLEPIGVEHVFGNRKEHDDYLCFRGWFRVGNKIFSSFCEALRAYDDTVVTRKQGNSMVEDFNLPHEWDFGSAGGCPRRLGSFKCKPAPKSPPLLDPTSQRWTTVTPTPNPHDLLPAASAPTSLGMAISNGSWADCKSILEQGQVRCEERCQGYLHVCLRDIEIQSRQGRILERHGEFMEEETSLSQRTLVKASEFLSGDMLTRIQMYDQMRAGRFVAFMAQLRDAFHEALSLSFCDMSTFRMNQEMRWKMFLDGEKSFLSTFFHQ
jgi:hypothetical protein